MIVAQAEGCAPVVRAWNEKKKVSEAWANASTSASGLRVPKPYGDYIILDILHQSNGTAVAVSDAEMMSCVKDWAAEEGVFASPEGAASLAVYRKLRQSGFLKGTDQVVLFNTGSGYKYLDTIQQASHPTKLPSGRNIGGIIGPY
jgi:threonine synthase